MRTHHREHRGHREVDQWIIFFRDSLCSHCSLWFDGYSLNISGEMAVEFTSLPAVGFPARRLLRAWRWLSEDPGVENASLVWHAH